MTFSDSGLEFVNIEAFFERLDRLHHERDDRLADRLLVIGKDCAARLTVTNFRSEGRRP